MYLLSNLYTYFLLHFFRSHWLIWFLSVCDHLGRKSGYAAVFGPEHHELTHIVNSITTTKKIPHIKTRLESETLGKSDIRINLYPEAKELERVGDSIILILCTSSSYDLPNILKMWLHFQAIGAVLDDMDWDAFTLIYDSPESLISLQDVLKKRLGQSKFDRPRVMMKLIPKSEPDYR